VRKQVHRVEDRASKKPLTREKPSECRQRIRNQLGRKPTTKNSRGTKVEVVQGDLEKGTQPFGILLASVGGEVYAAGRVRERKRVDACMEIGVRPRNGGKTFD